MLLVELNPNCNTNKPSQERAMLLKQVQPPVHRPRRRELTSIDMDPAALSSSLREFSIRAHRLIRTLDESRSQPVCEVDPGFLFNLEQELFELHSQIAKLERRLKAQRLGDLADYVSALRHHV